MYTSLPTTVEIELSTRCNASCPQCSRNYFGAFTWPGLPLLNIDIEQIKQSLTPSILANLKKIRLYGTYGEPCIHPKFLEFAKWLTKNTQASIIVSTNGSLRTVRWWRKLGKILRCQDKVVFCVDGLEDTNHLYRKDTDFNKIKDNIQAFNQSGGQSFWHFIVFEHNQHQVEKAKQLSNQLGCVDFAIKKTARFINKQHKRINEFAVLNKNEMPTHFLKMPTIQQYVNPGYAEYDNLIVSTNDFSNYLRTTEISCGAKNWCSFYISAEGYVLPCGWLADRFYGFEAESHKDRQQLFNLINDTGGLDQINIKYNTIENILYGDFFKAVEKSWYNYTRIERCASQCGTGVSAYKKSTEEMDHLIKKN